MRSRLALVTGANGFTGANLVSALVRQDWMVNGLVRDTSDLSRLAGLPIVLHRGDIADRRALRSAMAGVSVVFHTAAMVDLGVVDAREMARVNVDGTRAVVDAVQACGVPRLVHCSAVDIYGDTGGRIVDETFERTGAACASAYERTKLEAQAVVDAACRNGLPGVSVMPSGVVGRGDPHFGPIVDRVLKGRLRYWPCRDRPTGIVHVEDLAKGMMLAADYGRSGDHYILSAGEISSGEMLGMLAAAAGVPEPREAPEWAVRALGALLDPLGRCLRWNPPLNRERVRHLYDRRVRVRSDKARTELGWRPRPPADVVRSLLA